MFSRSKNRGSKSEPQSAGAASAPTPGAASAPTPGALGTPAPAAPRRTEGCAPMATPADAQQDDAEFRRNLKRRLIG
jgi:hypothetical protein